MSTATTTHASEPGALRWYRWLVWAGIIANVVVGVVSIAYTAQVLALARVDPATPLVWPRLSAMLVMLLAGFYIPAAIDPCAHRFAAVFAVVCRFAGTIFMAAALLTLANSSRLPRIQSSESSRHWLRPANFGRT